MNIAGSHVSTWKRNEYERLVNQITVKLSICCSPK